jgi:tRNA nucleotidyltransferase (CCA-adding enzyme)
MAYSDKTGLIDLHGGQQDMEDNILRCVGDPMKRFEEDALRIMRVLRFMSERGFTCEEKTEEALRALKNNLLKIAPERIAVEFDRLLLGEHAEKVIIEYYDVLGVIFPELIKCAGFDQQNKHHIFDVLTHTAKAIAVAPDDIVIRLALFFHDISKPMCFEVRDGIGHAPGHPAKSAEIAEKTMRRLRYNKATIYKVVLLVEGHRDKLRDDVITVKSLLNKYGPKTLIQLCELKIADDTAKAGFLYLEIPKHRHVIEKAREVIKSGECYSLGALAINGNDLLKLGFGGRDVGTKLRKLLELVITGRAENRKEVLLEIAKKD